MPDSMPVTVMTVHTSEPGEPATTAIVTVFAQCLCKRVCGPQLLRLRIAGRHVPQPMSDGGQLDKWWEDRLSRRGGSASKAFNKRSISPVMPLSAHDSMEMSGYSRSKNYLMQRKDGTDVSTATRRTQMSMSRLLGEEVPGSFGSPTRADSAEVNSPHTVMGRKVWQGLRRLFTSLDITNIGRVDRKELMLAMKSDPLARHCLDDASFEQVFTMLDGSESLFITWEQFELAALSQAVLPEISRTTPAPALGVGGADYGVVKGAYKPLVGGEWWHASSLSQTEQQCMEHINLADIKVRNLKQRYGILTFVKGARNYLTLQPIRLLGVWRRNTHRTTSTTRGIIHVYHSLNRISREVTSRNLATWRHKAFAAMRSKVMSYHKLLISRIKVLQNAIPCSYGVSMRLGIWRRQTGENMRRIIQAQKQKTKELRASSGKSYDALMSKRNGLTLRSLRYNIVCTEIRRRLQKWRISVRTYEMKKRKLYASELKDEYEENNHNAKMQFALSILQSGMLNFAENSKTLKLKQRTSIWRERCMRSRRKATAKNQADLHALTVCRNQLSRIRHRKLVGATLSAVEAWRRNSNAFSNAKERHITAVKIVRLLFVVVRIHDSMSDSTLSSSLAECSLAEWRRRSTDDITSKLASKRKVMNQGIAMMLFGRSLSQQTQLMQKIGLGIWHANASTFYRKQQFALLEESNKRQQEVLALFLNEVDGQSDEDEDDSDNEEFDVPQSNNQLGSKQNSSMRRKDTATDSTHLRRKR